MSAATATRATTLTASAGHLADRIGWVATHTPTICTVPVLAGVHLAITPDGTVATTGDYDTWARADLDIDADGDAQVVLPAKLFASLLATLPRTLMVTLAISGDRVTVSCGATNASIRTLPAEDFPTLAAWPDAIGTMAAADLAEATRQVVDAADTDSSYPGMCGIELTLSETGLMATATDRYRFALATAPWTPVLANDDQEHKALVPAVLLNQAAKAMAKTGDSVGIGLATGEGTADVLALYGDGLRLCTRLISAESIGWDRARGLIPDTATEVCVATAVLADAIKRVGLFAARGTAVRITITPGGLVVSAGADDESAASEKVDAQVDTDQDEIKLAVRPDYLLLALTTPRCERMRLSIGGATKPLLVRTDDDEETGYMHIVMPIRQP
ncbi:DNA polymerase III subunit beta [Nocardiopsis sp. NPDC057823]|uniref:DNA polymerase III subunit beta n=1 Tax=Nocardiopsis sp. NPDC057823 TaxID=3346256 RepID=UPI00366DA004